MVVELIFGKRKTRTKRVSSKAVKKVKKTAKTVDLAAVRRKVEQLVKKYKEAQRKGDKKKAEKILRELCKIAKHYHISISLEVTQQKHLPRSKSDIKLDAKRKALPPGWRISKNGKVYYENRDNRSDKPGKKV